MKYALLILTGFFPLISYGETKPASLAEISGNGLIKTPADYVSLIIAVHSECEVTPNDAQSDTDAAVKEIDDYLQTLRTKDDEHFKILIDGGYTSSYSRWHNNRELCPNSYQKVTRITLSIGMRNDFDKIFSALQTFVLNKFQQGPALDEMENSRTYVSVGIPTPLLTKTHKTEAEREVLGIAMVDAMSKLKAVFAGCELNFWEVQTVHEEGGIHPFPGPQAYSMTAKGAGVETGGVAPVKFDSLETVKTINVTFRTESACFRK